MQLPSILVFTVLPLGGPAVQVTSLAVRRQKFKWKKDGNSLRIYLFFLHPPNSWKTTLFPCRKRFAQYWPLPIKKLGPIFLNQIPLVGLERKTKKGSECKSKDNVSLFIVKKYFKHVSRSISFRLLDLNIWNNIIQ